MKKDFLLIPLFFSFYGSCYGFVRGVMDISDKPKLTDESIMHQELYGFNSYVFFEHSDEFTSISYWKNGQELISMMDYDFDDKVDSIINGDNEYLRKEGSRFNRADEKFRKYCEILDCEQLMQEWDISRSSNPPRNIR